MTDTYTLADGRRVEIAVAKNGPVTVKVDGVKLSVDEAEALRREFRDGASIGATVT